MKSLQFLPEIYSVTYWLTNMSLATVCLVAFSCIINFAKQRELCLKRAFTFVFAFVFYTQPIFRYIVADLSAILALFMTSDSMIVAIRSLAVFVGVYLKWLFVSVESENAKSVKRRIAVAGASKTTSESKPVKTQFVCNYTSWCVAPQFNLLQ